MRKRSRMAVASCSIIGLILLANWSLRSKPAGKFWLSASTPVFGTRTNADGIIPTVFVFMTNVGPRSLNYRVHWLECRERTDLALLATNETSAAPAFPSLASGATTKLTWDLPPSHLSSPDRFFCCSVHWYESEPILWRLGRKVEPHISRTLQLFDSQAVPPWESPSKVRARGTLFVSNVGTEEYFRLAHGLTREGWLEDVRRSMQVRTQAFTEAYGQLPRMGLADRAKQEARSAFVEFCQTTTTNLWDQAELRAAPDAESGNRMD